MRHSLFFKTSFIAIVFISNSLLAADRLEMIPLKHRTANELIPIIAPLLGKDATVTGQGFNLIIRAPEQSLEQVHDIIARLDQAPKRLRISVRQQQAGSLSRQDIGVSGTISSGDVKIQLNDPGPARLKLHESNRRSAKNGIQTIHTLEGRQAFIQVGRLIPVPERSVDQFGNQRESIQYKNATTGFYVVARMNDDQVSLDISPHSISLDRNGQHGFNIQQAQTTVRGKIGTWIFIGGVQQKRHSSSKGISYSTRRNDGLNSGFQIRVDVISE